MPNFSTSEPYILGIETSCDETAASVVKGRKVLSNIISSQKEHIKFGGVVPELASRLHQKSIVPIVEQALEEASIHFNDLHAISVTQGPGLMGALLVGVSYAKSLALSLNIPLLMVNHIQSHILIHFAEDLKPPKFPFLSLTVSGGHTQIILVEDYFKMKILGQTIDDAAGEAFDKIAKILGLKYPGGPLIDKLSQKGNKEAFKFPHPKAPELNFSFSGLKTAVLYFIKKQPENFIQNHLLDFCASIQNTITSILIKKLSEAVKQTGINQIALAGGVSANSELRNRIKQQKNWEVYLPKKCYTTDNAAMIAITGYYKYLNNLFSEFSETAQPRLPI